MSKKIALITGSSSGIGKEIALELSKLGIAICINYVKSDKDAIEVRDMIVAAGGEAVIFKADISSEDDVKDMMGFLAKEYGKLDYLINNAGINLVQTFEDYDLKAWNDILNINLTGKFLCIKYAVPLLKRSADPRIINIASRFGTKAGEEIPAYCCAEAGVIMLTRVSALELSKHNIKVNTVSPSLTRTPLTEKICPEEEFQEYAMNNPLGRVGEAIDIANAVSFLISDKSGFINGENINVSGGMLLR